MKNRLYLALEFIVLYIGIPAVFYFELIAIPKIVALLAVALVSLLILWFDERHDFSQLFNYPTKGIPVRDLLAKSLGVACAIIFLVMFLHPADLFLFPRERPVVWMVVMLLYPLLSALPQELIYRAFLFQRYRPLFPSELTLAIASVLTFSGLHLVYDNWWAVGLSLIGGFIFVRTYRTTKSLYWVSLEHAIYGCLVFTIGMGNYFYEAF